jgi:hypothetical protein
MGSTGRVNGSGSVVTVLVGGALWPRLQRLLNIGNVGMRIAIARDNAGSIAELHFIAAKRGFTACPALAMI